MIYVEKLLSGLQRLNRPPRYCPKTDDKAPRRNWPETVVGHGFHLPKRGVVDIREVPDGYAAELIAIDARRAELQAALAELRQQEQQILALAWQTGTPVRVAALKAAKAAAEAAKTAAETES